MLGFSVMMWFVSIILLLVGFSLLKGNTAALHGRVFEQTNDKEGYARAMGKPVFLTGVGFAISGIAALLMNRLIYAIMIIFIVVMIAGVCFFNIQKRFCSNSDLVE